jgi:hypothetical protein
VDDDDDVPLAAFLFESTSTAVGIDTGSVGHDNDQVTRAASFTTTSPPIAATATTTMGTTAAETKTVQSAHPPVAQRQQQQRQPPPLQRPLVQTTLDIGQRGSDDVGQRCPRCHMLFNTHVEDVQLHRRFCHAQQRRGGKRRHMSEGGGDAAETACGGTRRGAGADVRAGARAVALLEVVLGTPISASSTDAATHRADAHWKRRTRPSQTSTTAFSDKVAIAPSTTITTTTVPSSFEVVSTSIGTLTGSSLSSSSTPLLHPLEVVVLQCRGNITGACLVAGDDGGEAATLTSTLISLLDCIDFTCHLIAPEPSATKMCVHTREGNVDERPATTLVLVVDVALRQLLCAVAGHAREREQDPELCLQQRADGSTQCSTHRVFSFGDVAGVWCISASALARAQREWEEKAVAPYVSSQSAMKRLFHVATTPCKTTATNNASTSNSSSSSSGKQGGRPEAEGAVAQQQQQEQQQQRHHRQVAVGVAVYTLARRLIYGQTLSPFTQLSYARSILTATREATAVGAVGCAPPPLMTCSQERTRNDTKEGLCERGEAWLVSCLRAATPMFAGSDGSNTAFSPEVLLGADDMVGLRFHEDEADEHEEMTTTPLWQKQRRDNPSACALGADVRGDDGDITDELSVVSYSSDT